MQIGKFIFHAVFWRALHLLTVFIINILLARYLGAAVSGPIFLFINNLALLILVVSGCLETGLTYYTATRQISIQKLSTLSFTWSVLATAFVVLLIMVLPLSSQQLLLWPVALYVWGNLLVTYYTSFFYAHKRFLLPSQLLTGINVVLIVLIQWQHAYGDSGFLHRNLTGLYFISFIVQGAAVYGVFRSRFVEARNWVWPAKDELMRIWKYIRVAIQINIVFFLVYRVDYWLVANFCTSEQLGNYIQVSKIGQVFLLLPGMLAAIVFPVTAGDTDNTIAKELPVVSRLLFILYLFLLLILMATGHFLFPLLYGDTFTGMYAAFVWLTPGILALSIQSLLTAYYAGRNKLIHNLKGAVLTLIVIITGDVFMIPRYGINGAAIVSSAGYIVYMIYMINIFTQEHGVKAIHFFLPHKKDWDWAKRQLLHIDE